MFYNSIYLIEELLIQLSTDGFNNNGIKVPKIIVKCQFNSKMNFLLVFLIFPSESSIITKRPDPNDYSILGRFQKLIPQRL